MTFVLPTLSGKSYLFNVMDCPGHLNFSDESCSAIRIADGIVLVVDAVAGSIQNPFNRP